MVDHVTHHEMEQEKRRRHLELQDFTRKHMKEKEQTIFVWYAGNMVITPSIYVSSRGVLISPGSEFDSETNTRMPLTDQILNRNATIIYYLSTATFSPSLLSIKSIRLSEKHFSELLDG